MSRKIVKVLITFMMIVSLTSCAKENNNDGKISIFTENIDNCWKENNIDTMLNSLHGSETELADIKAEMHKLYGENKEIIGEYDKALAAKAINGTYVGKIVSDDVISWKGIPYAKQPIGDLRWRAPQEPDASEKVYKAYYFGKSAVQAQTKDEPSGVYPQGEDCLNINIWKNTSDSTDIKPIMVWIHGGAYI